MPTFSHPWALLLLVLIPLALRGWRRGQASVRFSDVRLLVSLPRGRSRQAHIGGLVLRGLALLCLVVAVAGPRWPDPGARVETEGIAIAMVVDVSASMADLDYLEGGRPTSRLDVVKKVFHQFVEGDSDSLPGRPSDLIMLVAFASRPETACPLTLDHQALLRILDNQEPRALITEATTNPGDAIAWALVSLQKAPTRRKVIIFLTDGEGNVPTPALTPRQAAQLAGNLSIPIYAIDAGPIKTDDPEAAARAKKMLEDLARIAKGKYFRAADSQALRIATKEIDQLERDRLPTHGYRRYHEGFVWFALASLACWLTVLTLEATRWRRIP